MLLVNNIIRTFFIILLIFTVPVQSKTKVHSAIIIANDYSSSMDKTRLDFQFEALVEALRSEKFIKYLRYRTIAIKYMPWADRAIHGDWYILRNKNDVEKFISSTRIYNNTYVGNGEKSTNSLGVGTNPVNVMEIAFQIFKENSINATRHVLDISSDGPGYGPERALNIKQKFKEQGFISNCIVMFNDTEPAAYNWHRRYSVVGPGSFIIQVERNNVKQYIDKFYIKFINEIG